MSVCPRGGNCPELCEGCRRMEELAQEERDQETDEPQEYMMADEVYEVRGFADPTPMDLLDDFYEESERRAIEEDWYEED